MDGFKRISGLVASIAFIADLLTIFLFIRDLIRNDLTFGSGIALVALFLGIFIFALLLLNFSEERVELAITLFAWLYVTSSAVFLSIVAKRFVLENSYTFRNYLTYVSITITIAALGYIIAKTREGRVFYLSLPFMASALWQIFLWLYVLYNRMPIDFFNWLFIGNLGLFAINGLIIFTFIKVGDT